LNGFFMIKARFIIEAQVGLPKGADHKKLGKKLETALKQHIEAVKQIENLKVHDEVWEDTEEMEGMLSALVDIGVEAKDFENFFSAILRSAPTAVVMEDPEKLEIDIREMQNVVNDFVQLFHLLAQANATMAVKSAELQSKADNETILIRDGEN